MKNLEQLLTKYGISNSEYRLIKEIVLVKLEVTLLENNKNKIADKYKDKKIRSTSELGNKLEEILSLIENSLKKKKEKLLRLNKEFIDTYNSPIQILLEINNA